MDLDRAELSNKHIRSVDLEERRLTLILDWTDGWMDGLMDGQTDRQTGKQMDTMRRIFQFYCHSFVHSILGMGQGRVMNNIRK